MALRSAVIAVALALLPEAAVNNIRAVRLWRPNGAINPAEVRLWVGGRNVAKTDALTYVSSTQGSSNDASFAVDDSKGTYFQSREEATPFLLLTFAVSLTVDGVSVVGPEASFSRDIGDTVELLDSRGTVLWTRTIDAFELRAGERLWEWVCTASTSSTLPWEAPLDTTQQWQTPPAFGRPVSVVISRPGDGLLAISELQLIASNGENVLASQLVTISSNAGGTLSHLKDGSLATVWQSQGQRSPTLTLSWSGYQIQRLVVVCPTAFDAYWRPLGASITFLSPAGAVLSRRVISAIDFSGDGVGRFTAFVSAPPPTPTPAMTAGVYARAIRVRKARVDGAPDNLMNIAEVRAYNSAGVNVAAASAGATAAVSSLYPGDCGPPCLIDGNAGSFFHSAADDPRAWALVSFPATCSGVIACNAALPITEVHVVGRPDIYAPRDLGDVVELLDASGLVVWTSTLTQFDRSRVWRAAVRVGEAPPLTAEQAWSLIYGLRAMRITTNWRKRLVVGEIALVAGDSIAGRAFNTDSGENMPQPVDSSPDTKWLSPDGVDYSSLTVLLKRRPDGSSFPIGLDAVPAHVGLWVGTVQALGATVQFLDAAGAVVREHVVVALTPYSLSESSYRFSVRVPVPPGVTLPAPPSAVWRPTLPVRHVRIRCLHEGSDDCFSFRSIAELKVFSSGVNVARGALPYVIRVGGSWLGLFEDNIQGAGITGAPGSAIDGSDASFWHSGTWRHVTSYPTGTNFEPEGRVVGVSARYCDVIFAVDLGAVHAVERVVVVVPPSFSLTTRAKNWLVGPHRWETPSALELGNIVELLSEDGSVVWSRPITAWDSPGALTWSAVVASPPSSATPSAASTRSPTATPPPSLTASQTGTVLPSPTKTATAAQTQTQTRTAATTPSPSPYPLAMQWTHFNSLGASQVAPDSGSGGLIYPLGLRWSAAFQRTPSGALSVGDYAQNFDNFGLRVESRLPAGYQWATLSFSVARQRFSPSPASIAAPRSIGVFLYTSDGKAGAGRRIATVDISGTFAGPDPQPHESWARVEVDLQPYNGLILRDTFEILGFDPLRNADSEIYQARLAFDVSGRGVAFKEHQQTISAVGLLMRLVLLTCFPP